MKGKCILPPDLVVLQSSNLRVMCPPLCKTLEALNAVDRLACEVKLARLMNEGLFGFEICIGR